MRMTRRVAAVLGLGLLASSVGCKYFPYRPSKPDPMQSALSGGGAPKPALLVGPDGGGSTITELSTKDAIVAWLATAHEMEKNNESATAIELYLKARAAEPRLGPDIGRRLAVLYDRVEDFTKAQAEYDLALKAHPADPELLADLGYSYYCRGDWPRAEETFRQVVTNHPDHKRAWMNLGLTLCATERFQDGHEAFRKTGSEAEARVNLAFALAVQGRTDDAKGQYRTALQMEPGMTIARDALAALENPKPVRKKAVKLADDIPPEHQVPTFQELEKRLQEADAAKPATARDLPPVELKGPPTRDPTTAVPSR